MTDRAEEMRKVCRNVQADPEKIAGYVYERASQIMYDHELGTVELIEEALRAYGDEREAEGMERAAIVADFAEARAVADAIRALKERP